MPAEQPIPPPMEDDTLSVISFGGSPIDSNDNDTRKASLAEVDSMQDDGDLPTVASLCRTHPDPLPRSPPTPNPVPTEVMDPHTPRLIWDTSQEDASPFVHSDRNQTSSEDVRTTGAQYATSTISSVENTHPTSISASPPDPYQDETTSLSDAWMVPCIRATPARQTGDALPRRTASPTPQHQSRAHLTQLPSYQSQELWYTQAVPVTMRGLLPDYSSDDSPSVQDAVGNRQGDFILYDESQAELQDVDMICASNPRFETSDPPVSNPSEEPTRQDVNRGETANSGIPETLEHTTPTSSTECTAATSLPPHDSPNEDCRTSLPQHTELTPQTTECTSQHMAYLRTTGADTATHQKRQKEAEEEEEDGGDDDEDASGEGPTPGGCRKHQGNQLHFCEDKLDMQQVLPS